STPNGLARATVTGTAIPDLRVQVARYDESDGLQGAHFNENAGARLRSGELVFGGLNGFNIFNPDKITPNAYIPPVVINGFELFNKRIGVGEPVHDGDPVLPQSITETATITLQHHHDFFALQFVALNYLHPEKNQYQYRLEGFNKDWITADPHTRKATYTNLDPGRYTFRVRASNNDAAWNDVGAAVDIVVEPPFWKSELAFVLYVIFLAAILLAARKLLLLRERANVRLQQERAEAQRMHELDLMKIRFFTNVSHEFRTPLALILAPLEKLTQQADDGHARQFQLIQRNARRLLNLVNQLLDFRKLETQGIPYYPAAGDLVQFVRETTYSFSDLSEKKDIHLSFYTALERLDTLFDQDKLEKILFNLLSNAFKFTPEHGRISVRLDHAPGADDATPGVRICVEDTGIGIPVEKQGRIFERFFQHDLPTGMINQGSGIGLAITREFVKVHGGTISVESEPEKGSRFTILLPLQPIPQAGTAAPVPVPLAATAPVAIPIPQPPRDGRKPILLLVEDNHDFRFYLQDNLREEYTVLEASTGTEGWHVALESIPDLVVSDVMMPGLSGTDLCRRLKSDERTSHIPVVLLTARSSEEQKREGYATGANDYVVKPFSVEILQSRLRNMVRQQEATRKSFQHYLAVKGSAVNITPLDEKLVSKAVAIVEANLEDADFSVEALSHELGMSRIHLYRKISSLTGKTPVEFIRSVRLQHAAQLLEKSQLTIAEIAYRVGFNNPKYFTRQFKDMYHVVPSEYAMRGVKKDTPFSGGGFAHGVS
ncbi:hybrid sensor histidine kinase/response regulator transcription factor, partial [Dawidia soli]